MVAKELSTNVKTKRYLQIRLLPRFPILSKKRNNLQTIETPRETKK